MSMTRCDQCGCGSVIVPVDSDCSRCTGTMRAVEPPAQVCHRCGATGPVAGSKCLTCYAMFGANGRRRDTSGAYVVCMKCGALAWALSTQTACYANSGACGGELRPRCPAKHPTDAGRSCERALGHDREHLYHDSFGATRWLRHHREHAEPASDIDARSYARGVTDTLTGIARIVAAMFGPAAPKPTGAPKRSGAKRVASKRGRK